MIHFGSNEVLVLRNDKGFSGLPLFCYKARAGETPHSVEFLSGGLMSCFDRILTNDHLISRHSTFNVLFHFAMTCFALCPVLFCHIKCIVSFCHATLYV